MAISFHSKADQHAPPSSPPPRALSRSHPRTPSSSRLPAAPPLAPLEYLQLHQRRGSITDPSLHASSNAASSPPHPSVFPPPSSPQTNQQNSNPPGGASYYSNFTFPPVSSRNMDTNSNTKSQTSSANGRDAHTLSPVSDTDPDRPLSAPRTVEGGQRGWAPNMENKNGDDDSARLRAEPARSGSATSSSGPSTGNGRSAQDIVDQSEERKPSTGSTLGPPGHDLQFDYNMRRHSIAVPPMRSREGSPPGGPDAGGHPSAYGPGSHNHHPSFMPPPSLSGQKRKVSHDRGGYHFGGDEFAPSPTHYASPLGNGPMDTDGPGPPKRRGSAFDTRISQLSLYDRRDSLDSRSSIGGGQWVPGGGDRRDSTASMYSNASMASSIAGYTTASTSFSGEGHPLGGKPPFSWSNNNNNHEDGEANAPRPFAGFPPQPPVGNQDGVGPLFPGDSQSAGGQRPMAQSPAIAQLSYEHRRMSVPDVMMKNSRLSEKPDNRTRSRPPSRGPNAGTPTGSGNVSDASAPSHMQVETHGANNGQQFSTGASLAPPGSGKETPYSRSPELRVSHKLAERKRRKEMKELFDELRDQLPADRGMKASKWEILSKAVDYIGQLKIAYTDMSSEIDRLRHENDSLRQSHNQVPASHPPYAPQVGHYGPQPGPAGAYPHPGQQQPSQPPQPQPPSHHHYAPHGPPHATQSM